MTATPAASERTLSQLQEFATPRARDSRVFRHKKTGEIWPFHPGLEDDEDFELLASNDPRALKAAAAASAAPLSTRPATSNLVLRRKSDNTVWPYDANLAAEAGFELLELRPLTATAASSPAPASPAPATPTEPTAEITRTAPARTAKFAAPPVKAKPTPVEESSAPQSRDIATQLDDLE